MIARLRERARARLATYSLALESDSLDVLRILTLMMVGQFLGVTRWYVQAPMTSLVVLGVLFRAVRANAVTWWVATFVMAYWGRRNWYLIDNHAYLYIIWLFALSVTALVEGSEQRRVIGNASRLLIGLVMALAALQKLASPSYTNGSFMEFVLLFDQRFQTPAWWGAGLDLPTLMQNIARMADWVETSAGLPNAALHVSTSGAHLDWLVFALTWGGIVVEGALGCAFLIPGSNATLVVVRTVMLMIFVVLTYPLAPVVGFGWVLLVMGFAQVPTGFRRLRIGVLALFIVLPLCVWSPAKVSQHLQS